MRRQFTLYFTVYVFSYMATCHADVYSLREQQVNTISLKPFKSNAVHMTSPAINDVFEKLKMFNSI